jgi:hypothetical protein
MSQKAKTEEQLKEEQLERERIIKFAASFGVTLTVSDEISEQGDVPEKYKNMDEIFTNMNWINVER